MLIIVNADGPISNDARRQIVKSIQAQLPGQRGTVLVGTQGMKIEAVQPYCYREEFGDYAKQFGFPCERDMLLFNEKQMPGLWYDWDSGESNDPRWGELCNGATAKVKATGEKVERLLFYHTETHTSIRYVADSHVPGVPGVCRQAGAAAVIWDNRELEICVAPAKASMSS